MMIEKSNGIWRFENLNKAGVVHGVYDNSIVDIAGDRERSFETIKRDIKKDVRFLKQVHSKEVIKASSGMNEVAADAWLVDDNIFAYGIYTADCIPIIAIDVKQNIGLAIHAGWKGIVAGVVRNSFTKLKEKIGDNADVLVGIGPHLQVKDFEFIGREDILGDKYREYFLDNYRVDFTKMAVYEILESGVNMENIEISNVSTFNNDNDFASFRKRSDKRFASVLSIQ